MFRPAMFRMVSPIPEPMTDKLFRVSILTLALAACTPGVDVDVRRASQESMHFEPPAANSPADLNGPFEPSPRMRSADLLPGLPLVGPDYQVARRAQVVDYFGQFSLRSSVGILTADGAQVLRLRVREIDAIKALDRVTPTQVFNQAVVRGVEKPVGAVRQVAAEPGATASGLPNGIGRYLHRVALNLRDLALDLNDAARDAIADEDDNEGQGNQSSNTDKAAKITKAAALRYIGYNKARRDIARQVGVDPYSTNPLLVERLDRLAWASWSGAKLVGLSIGLIGGVAGQALGYTRDAYELVWELPPEDLKRRNLLVLEEIGIGGKRARDLIRRGKRFTLTQQTEFVELLRLPLFEPARKALFDLALAAEREVHARFLIDAMRLLIAADKNEAAGARATVVGTSPALRRPDGSFVVALPVDYVHWTAEIAQFAWRDDLIGRKNVLLVTGSLSPLALESFSQAGWTIRERIDPQAIAPIEDTTQTAPLR